MVRGTTFQCPRCGTDTTLGINIKGAPTFSGGEMNVAVPCPACGHFYDAAPEDGTYRLIAGRLQLVKATKEATSRIAQAHATPEDLRQLQAVLSEGQRAGGTPRELVERLQGFDALQEWARENPAIFQLIAGVLQAIVTVALTAALTAKSEAPAPLPEVSVVVEVPSDEQLERMVEDLIDKCAGD